MKKFYSNFVVILVIFIGANFVWGMESKKDQPVKLNVGGEIYIYHKSTLINSSHYFSSLLSGNYKNITFEDGSIFISYSKEAFKEVDHFLTTGKLLLRYNIDVIIESAKFFGMDELLTLANENDFSKEKSNELKKFKQVYTFGSGVICPECKKLIRKINFYDFHHHLVKEHNANIESSILTPRPGTDTEYWKFVYRIIK